MTKEENEYYDNLNKAIKQLPKICEQAHKAFEKMFKESPRILLETKKAIQDMPEDKFVEFCNKLEPRQQELAYRMRGVIDENTK